MEEFDYNGLDKAGDKYVSLSYIVDPKWKIPQGKVAYLLEPRTLGDDRRSDALLEKMRIPELITFVSNAIPRRTLSVLNSIHSASVLTQNYLDATCKAYEFGIKRNVIERVCYFYPWVRCFQDDTALELTFFTLVEYRNHRRAFKVIKLIPDDLPSQVSILEYLEEVWENPAPTIHIESEIYSYLPPNSGPYNPEITEICCKSIFQLFVRQNFNLELRVSDAEIGLIGIGELIMTDDKKPRLVQRKLLENVCYVSVTPSIFDDYFSYARKAYEALTYMETYRDVFFAYKRMCKKRKLDERQKQAKQAYERFLMDFARKQGIRLDISLEEFIHQKRKKECMEFIIAVLDIALSKMQDASSPKF